MCGCSHVGSKRYCSYWFSRHQRKRQKIPVGVLRPFCSIRGLIKAPKRSDTYSVPAGQSESDTWQKACTLLQSGWRMNKSYLLKQRRYLQVCNRWCRDCMEIGQIGITTVEKTTESIGTILYYIGFGNTCTCKCRHGWTVSANKEGFISSLFRTLKLVWYTYERFSVDQFCEVPNYRDVHIWSEAWRVRVPQREQLEQCVGRVSITVQLFSRANQTPSTCGRTN